MATTTLPPLPERLAALAQALLTRAWDDPDTPVNGFLHEQAAVVSELLEQLQAGVHTCDRTRRDPHARAGPRPGALPAARVP